MQNSTTRPNWVFILLIFEWSKNFQKLLDILYFFIISHAYWDYFKQSKSNWNGNVNQTTKSVGKQPKRKGAQTAIKFPEQGQLTMLILKQHLRSLLSKTEYKHHWTPFQRHPESTTRVNTAFLLSNSNQLCKHSFQEREYAQFPEPELRMQQQSDTHLWLRRLFPLIYHNVRVQSV